MFIVAVLNFVLSPFIVHSLGNDAYGAWILLSSLVGYLGLLDLGVRGAVTKYVATLHARAEHDEAGHVASAALTLFSGAGLLAVLLSFGFAAFGLQAFEVSPDFIAEAQYVLRLGGGTIAISIIGGVFGGIVVGRQRFDVMNTVSLLIEFGRAATIYFALSAGGGLIELAWIQFSVALLQAVASYVLSRRIYPELHVRQFKFQRKHLNMVMSYGLVSTMLHVAGSLINYTDALVIGAYLPVAMITFFAISSNLIEQARNVASGISRVITPVAGALDGLTSREDTGEVLLLGVRYATLVSMPIVITLIARGHSFIGLWMGPEYAEPAGDVLLMLATGLWVYVSFQISTAFMMGLNKHAGLVPVILIEAVCNVGLSIWLLEDFGIYGVAMGTTIPRIFICLIFAPWYNQRMVGLSPLRYLGEGIVRPSLAMILFAGGSYAIEVHWPAANLAIFFAQIALLGPLALIGTWFIFLSASERKQYRGVVLERLDAGRASR